MTVDWIAANWALVIASVLALALLLFVGWRVWEDSAGGRLQIARRNYERSRRERNAIQRRADARTHKLARLRDRAQDVSPRRLEEVAADLEDARALLKIAEDRVLVTAARLREIIVEEYPPRRHDALRRRYLGDDARI